MFQRFKKKDNRERVFHFVGDCIELNIAFDDAVKEQQERCENSMS